MNDFEGATQRFVREGGRARFRELYERLAPALYVWASVRIPRALRHRLDPEDLLQEVWFRAYEKMDTYDPERAPFRAWMYGIAGNVLRTQLRGIARHRTEQADTLNSAVAADLRDEATTVSRRVARDEGVRSLVKFLDGLDEPERKLLVLRGLEGLPHEEVGQRLDISASAAQVRWHRLREQLKLSSALEEILTKD